MDAKDLYDKEEREIATAARALDEAARALDARREFLRQLGERIGVQPARQQMLEPPPQLPRTQAANAFIQAELDASDATFIKAVEYAASYMPVKFTTNEVLDFLLEAKYPFSSQTPKASISTALARLAERPTSPIRLVSKGAGSAPSIYTYVGAMARSSVLTPHEKGGSGAVRS